MKDGLNLILGFIPAFIHIDWVGWMFGAEFVASTSQVQDKSRYRCANLLADNYIYLDSHNYDYTKFNGDITLCSWDLQLHRTPD